MSDVKCAIKRLQEKNILKYIHTIHMNLNVTSTIKIKIKKFVSTNCFRRIIGGLKNNVIYLSDLLEM